MSNKEKMKLQVLVSTMNLQDNDELIKKMNITTESITINQITDEKIKPINNSVGKNKVYSFNERGLSKSRNKAIGNSDADICVIADDDLVYVDNYKNIIIDTYNKYKDADIIVFYVASDNKFNQKPPLKEGKINFIRSMKVQSVQMTFRRKKILEKGIKFDEDYGTGSKNYMGEENIFLFDSLKSGLTIVSVPLMIANISEGESSWFKGYTKDYFKVKSRVFRRMSKKLWLALVLQFVIRKYRVYKNEISFKEALKSMFKPESEE